MKFKYLILSLCAICFSFLFPIKIDAAEISYCNYGTLKLTLPVTIVVEVKGFNATYPFDITKNYNYSDSLYVYNANTCTRDLKLPNFSGNNGLDIIQDLYNTYYVTTEYYYIYNNTYYLSPTPLKNGSYSTIDTTPPTISTSSTEFVVSVSNQKQLDFFSVTVMAYDTTDGTIVPEIIEDYYSDNYNVPGEYSIAYKACDKRGNCSKFLQTIHVIDDIPPSINGVNKITSYMSNPKTLFQIANTLSAIDNCDGDISTSIYIVESYYNINFPGIYYALFDVQDKSGNKLLTPFKVEINYVDDIPPTIEGATKFNSYLSNPMSTNYILSNLIVHDNISNISNSNLFIINDQYSPNKSKIGTYKIAISCLDDYGNEASPYLIEIIVYDDVKPTIDGINGVISYLSNPITVEYIKSKIIALDNHDGNITSRLEITSDNYTSNINKIGVYFISFIVSDYSKNNSNIFEVEIVCIDDVSPTINGNNFYTTLTTQKLDLKSITLSLEALDNVDGNISHLIELNEDTYSSKYNVAGNYYVTYYVCDKSGNLSIPFEVKITVNNNLSFISSLNNSSIHLNTNTLFTKNNILNLLNINEQEYNSIKIIEDTYSNNYKTAGKYIVTYEITNSDYTKEYITINISTFDTETQEIEPTIKENKKKTTIFSFIVAYFKNSFVTLFNRIKRIFTH